MKYHDVSVLRTHSQCVPHHSLFSSAARDLNRILRVKRLECPLSNQGILRSLEEGSSEVRIHHSSASNRQC